MDHSNIGAIYWEEHHATRQQKRALNASFHQKDGTKKLGRDLTREEMLQVIGNMIEAGEPG